MEDLQAWIDYLLKENGELKGQVAAKEAKLKQMEELRGKIVATEVELAKSRK